MKNRFAIILLTGVCLASSVAFNAYAQGRRRPMRPPPGHGPGNKVVPHPPMPGDRTLNTLMNQGRSQWRTAWSKQKELDDQQRTLLVHARNMLDRAWFVRDEHPEQARMYVQTAIRLINRSQRPNIALISTEQRVTIVLKETSEMVVRLRKDRLNHQADMLEKIMAQSRQARKQGRAEVALYFAMTAQRRSHTSWLDIGDRSLLERRCMQLENDVIPLVKKASVLAAEKQDPYMITMADQSRRNLVMAQRRTEVVQLRQRAELLEAARVRAETVLSTLDRKGFARRQVVRLLGETATALDHASEVAGGRSVRLVNHGRKLLNEGHDKLDEGDISAAGILGWKARRIAQTVVERSFGRPDAARVSDAIARTDRLLASMPPLTSSQKSLHARALLRQEEAKALLEEGRLRQALAQTRVAARLTQKAMDR